MRGTRRIRLSYANVMATIAVFLTLGGASYAAVTLPAKSVGRAQLKKAAVTPKKLSKTTKRYIARVGKGPAGPQGFKGDTGLRGVRGERGPHGQRGLPGADGATWSALLTGHGTSIPSSGGWSGVLRRASPSGVSAVTGSPATVAGLSPNRPLQVRDISARIHNDLPAGTKFVWSLFGDDGFDEAAPLISCTITGTDDPTDTMCGAAGPVTIPASSLLWVRIEYGAAGIPTSPGEAFWGMSVQAATGV